MRSAADLCIIPLQDYLGQDSRARINRPSTTLGNWTWRMSERDLSKEISDFVLKTTSLCGRNKRGGI